MNYNTLGDTDLEVTDLCLGTMTWGTKNTEAEGHAQIDRALAHGLNFIDTAEMYPVIPVLAENVGRTEEIVGSWFAKTGKRNDWVLATKITGANGGFCRDGAPISSGEIAKAVEGSLRRLQTDVIDLYQLHWPNRGSYCFRQNWDYDPSDQVKQDTVAHMEDVLGELQRQVAAGKIRHIGLSNESAWGVAKWLEVAERIGAPRMVSIQNEYSLLHRLFDTDLAEVTANEHVGLLAYSPLAFGMLTGKYRGGTVPEGTRGADTDGGMHGRMTPRAVGAMDAYEDIARKHGLNYTQMALAWCRQRPFMTSAIFGATSLEQLDEILPATELTLSDEVLAEISAAHRQHAMPY
ncbi:MAG: aldo/keto reductase [Rhodobacteraceae bacterium]|nr:aldo/keto reductase [Paracoccaceae bacterium]